MRGGGQGVQKKFKKLDMHVNKNKNAIIQKNPETSFADTSLFFLFSKKGNMFSDGNTATSLMGENEAN